jgi:DNA-binding NtrC family response regulator
MARFLIIDDKEVFAKNTAGFLEKSGDTARLAATGAAALAALSAGGLDAILMDFRVPDMDGAALIASLRDLNSAVPILVISGVASIELAVRAIKAGANDFLAKPISLTGLRERLLRLARQQQETRRKSAEATERALSQVEALSPSATGSLAKSRPGKTHRPERFEPSFMMFSALSLPG